MEININIHIRDLLTEDNRQMEYEKAPVIRVERSLRSAQFPSRRQMFNCNNGAVKAHPLVCPGCLTDSRIAPGCVTLPTRFFILRPRAPQHRTRRHRMPHETINETQLAPD
jgi:hypothetical protein